MESYFGSQTTDSFIGSNLQFTTRIVVHLIQKLLDKSSEAKEYHVFMDHYYTNPTLDLEFYKLKLHLTSTIMTNQKGLPNQTQRDKKLGGMKF